MTICIFKAPLFKEIDCPYLVLQVGWVLVQPDLPLHTLFVEKKQPEFLYYKSKAHFSIRGKILLSSFLEKPGPPGCHICLILKQWTQVQIKELDGNRRGQLNSSE